MIDKSSKSKLKNLEIYEISLGSCTYTGGLRLVTVGEIERKNLRQIKRWETREVESNSFPSVIKIPHGKGVMRGDITGYDITVFVPSEFIPNIGPIAGRFKDGKIEETALYMSAWKKDVTRPVAEEWKRLSNFPGESRTRGYKFM